MIRVNNKEINVGDVWRKNPHEWGEEAGQLVVVDLIKNDIIHYRYTPSVIHGRSWKPKETFLQRFEFVMGV